MMKTLTFVDAGVLITAARGQDAALQARALSILNDPQRDFASSSFVRLEVLPKALWAGKQAERAFYETFFNAVSNWPQSNDAVIVQAEREAAIVGLSGMDALHVAAAVLLGADELVTIEKPTESLHRTQSIKVISIR